MRALFFWGFGLGLIEGDDSFWGLIDVPFFFIVFWMLWHSGRREGVRCGGSMTIQLVTLVPLADEFGL